MIKESLTHVSCVLVVDDGSIDKTYEHAEKAGAKVLVDGLRRAGRKPTREGLIGALESMREHDVGGLWISYAAGSHQGSRFVDVVVVGASGRFAR